jgi:hypothetical protein
MGTSVAWVRAGGKLLLAIGLHRAYTFDAFLSIQKLEK